MYPDSAINILVGIGLAVTLAASFSSARKNMKQSVTKFKYRPKTWLQNIPPNVAAFILILEILAVFRIGTLDTSGSEELFFVRVAGLLVFIIASFFQYRAHKNLGDNYSQEIAIVKDHKLVTNKLYRFVRHPQYIGQIMTDIGAGVALAGFIILPLVIFVEAPLLLMRAKREDELLKNNFEDEWTEYKKKSGFILPFIG